jgi:hypothetical protein
VLAVGGGVRGTAFGDEALSPQAMEVRVSGSSTVAGSEEAVTVMQDQFSQSDDPHQILEDILGVTVSSLFNAARQNTGLVSVNQSSGNLVHQSNLRAFYLFTKDLKSQGPDIDVTSESVIDDVSLVESGVTEKKTLIDASFRDNTALLGVNQSAGNLNQQGNNLFLVVGGKAALSDADLATTRAEINELEENEATVVEDVITNSFRDSRGVFQVSQASGSVNIQQNNLVISTRRMNLE